MEAADAEQIERDTQDVVEAIKLFINSKVAESERAIQSKYGDSLIHTHGTGVLAYLKALMTFDAEDIAFAMDCLKTDVEASSYLRKEQSILSSFSGMLFGGAQKNKRETFKSMNMMQKHAEVTFAESYLLKAILSILTESNMVTFMKEGLAIRQAYNIYKSCYKFLVHVLKEEGQEGLKNYGIDNRFITSVYLGLGCFNLILSILPPKVLKLFEMIGFGGHREFGMQCLALGAEWPVQEACGTSPTSKVRSKTAQNFFGLIAPEQDPGSRKFLCDMVLAGYHIILSTMVQLPNCNFPLASKQLDQNLAKHPDSFFYLLFKGKVLQAERQIEEAITVLKRVVDVQKDWRQMAHICFWDIGICYAAIGNFEEASKYFDILYQENKWSKAIYVYLKAIMLYSLDKTKYKTVIKESLEEIPKLTKKVAGKSIPLEKFVARKGRKFFIQNERLLLPAYEILYIWNGFDLLPDGHLRQLSIEIDKVLEDLEKQQEEHKKHHPDEAIPYSSFYDDFCLARFFKGLVARELAAPSADMLVPEKVLVEKKLNAEQLKQFAYAQRQLEYIGLQADDIEYDHWILPFARYELGRLHLRAGEYEKSRQEFQAALNGGYADNEAGAQKRKASMESSLHVRIHNAMMKLKLLESLAGDVSPSVEDEDAGSNSDGDE